ncbi:MAG: hypothetical protein ACUVV3_01155 [Dehalococcoidia bacterium]
MAKATGLRFSESLSGHLAEGEDCWSAYETGRIARNTARFWVTVRIADLRSFIADPEHMAPMTGRLRVSGLGDSMPTEGARVHLFCRRNGEKRLLYYLPFRWEGKRYLLRGAKRLQNPKGLAMWRQMTTLYAELLRLDDEEGAVIERGVLRIGPRQVVLQGLSFRPEGTRNPIRFLADCFRFLRFSSREMRG